MIGGLLPPLVAHLMAETGEFTAKMMEAEAITKRVTGASGATWAQAGKAAMGVGGVMAAAAGTVALATIKMASDFDNQMERIHTMAGASQSEVNALKQKVIDLGAATGQGPTKLAEALYHVESVGYRGAGAMNVLTQSAKLASISGASLDQTTYGLTSVMQAYGAKTQDAAKWAAYFNAVVGAGDMQMDAFNQAVGTGYFSSAQTFRLSAQSAGAALAFMTDRGQHADVAATHLRMSLALLAAPSDKATKILTSLGLTGEETAKRQGMLSQKLKESHVTYSELANDLTKPDGFYVALQHLKKGLEDSGLSAQAANADLSRAFGGGKSDATILAMLQNLDQLNNKYVAVGKNMGNFAESYRASAETTAGQMARLKASAEGLGIEIGHDLMPYFVTFLGWVKQGTDWLRTHETAVKVIAALIGVTLVTGLALATAGAIAFAIATSEVWVPILAGVLVVEAIIAVLLLLWKNWHTVWNWIVGLATMVGAWLARKWHDVAKATSDVWNGIMGFFKKWWPLLLVVFIGPLAFLIGLWNRNHQAIMTIARAAWANVERYVIDPVRRFVHNVLLFIDGMKMGISQRWDNIVNNIRQFWQPLFQVGSWIMSGLWNGITSWFGKITAGVGNFLNGMLGWAKSILGINSPSKVFEEEVGRWIPEGVAVGIRVHSHVAESSVSGMAAKIRAAAQVAHASGISVPGLSIAGAAVQGAVSATSSGVIHVHLTSVATVDGKTLFTTQQERALQYQRRNSQAAFSS